MQVYTPIKATRTLTNSREPLLDNDMTIMSCNSGTVFPTTYSVDGMLCYRTDQKKLYQLKGGTTWVMLFDLNKSAVNKEYVDATFAKTSGTYAHLRAQATTKTDVGLNNIPNKISSSVELSDTNTLATSRAVYTVNNAIKSLTAVVNKNKADIPKKAALAGSRSVDFNCKRLNANDIVASGEITAFSDVRFKTDIKTIKDPIYKIRGLNGVTFRRKNTNDHSLGLIAQDVQRVMPEAVKKMNDEYLTVAYGNLVGLLVEGIKELDTRLARLEA